MIRALRALCATMLLVAASVLGLAVPAHAAALTNVELNTSASGAGDTGVRYTYTFTTTTDGTIGKIDFVVPVGTAVGTLTVSDYFGIGAGTPSLSGSTLTYTVTSPVAMTAGRTVLIAFEGVTNTNTVDSYVPSVTTKQTDNTVIDGATNGAAVAVTPSSTDIVIDVARVITFAASAPAINLAVSAASGGQADQTASPTTFNVATNAGNGYTVSVRANPLTSSGGKTVPTVTSGISTGVTSAAFPANTWGFTTGTLVNGGSGTFTVAGALASGQYVGFPATSQVVSTNTGPTNGDALPISARVKVDATQAAGTYTTQLIFTAAASY